MPDTSPHSLLSMAQSVAASFSALPQVAAIVAAGSVTGGSADAASDIDMYVYHDAEIPLDARAAIISARASRAALDNRFWELGDEWIEAASGAAVDVTYRTKGWIEEQLERVLARHEASTGYSTCFWYNVVNSTMLFDRTDWFSQLHRRAQQPYPEPLRRAIIAKNHPILRDLLSSAYLHQLEKAVERRDLVSINHRIAALLASYFDVLFAMNRVPHPGEKRLVKAVEERCAIVPTGMRQTIDSILAAAGDGDPQVIPLVESLINSLDELLLVEGLIDRTA